MQHRCKFFLVIAFTSLLTACSGGGGSDAVAPPAAPPPPSTAVTTTGVITGFGSVHVNGVEFDTDSTDFDSDDDVADETELKVGQVVTLTGTKNDDGVTGTAENMSMKTWLEVLLPALAEKIPAWKP